MHICMTFLLIAPFDLPKEKTKSGRLALRAFFATFLLCKGLRPSRLQNSPKIRAAIADAGLLVLSSSVDAFRVDAWEDCHPWAGSQVRLKALQRVERLEFPLQSFVLLSKILGGWLIAWSITRNGSRKMFDMYIQACKTKQMHDQKHVKWKH